MGEKGRGGERGGRGRGGGEREHAHNMKVFVLCIGIVCVLARCMSLSVCVRCNYCESMLW